jgi:hypothetical protein
MPRSQFRVGCRPYLIRRGHSEPAVAIFPARSAVSKVKPIDLVKRTVIPGSAKHIPSYMAGTRADNLLRPSYKWNDIPACIKQLWQGRSEALVSRRPKISGAHLTRPGIGAPKTSTPWRRSTIRTSPRAPNLSGLPVMSGPWVALRAGKGITPWNLKLSFYSWYLRFANSSRRATGRSSTTCAAQGLPVRAARAWSKQGALCRRRGTNAIE